MISVKQTKPFLALMNGDKVQRVVTSVGATTFFSEEIYTYSEGDTLKEVIGEKPIPTVEEFRKLFIDMDDSEIATERAELAK